MKKKRFYISFALIATFFIVYLYLPLILTKQHHKKTYEQLGLEVKTVQNGKEHFEYVEGGVGETILLLHGFQSDKNQWIPYCKGLIDNYHVVAVDLPGHGNSSRPKHQNYDLDSLAESIADFVKLKELNNFHLMGSSMGGGVATVYAYKYPEKLNSITLLNPLGIVQENKSDLQVLMAKGKNLLFPNDLDEFDEFTQMVSGRKLQLNSYLKKFVLNQMIKEYVFFKKVFYQLITSTPLDNILPKIKTRALILIGENDRIIHPSSFEYFVKLMPNSKGVRIEKGSHVFVGSYLEEAIKEMKDFLGGA